MAVKSHAVRLHHIIDAIRRIQEVVGPIDISAFETDWQRQWIVERGLQIVTEACRHLPPELKARRAEVPWKDIWGLGNVLRHDYEQISPPILWKIAREDLHQLQAVCEDELRMAARATPPELRRPSYAARVSRLTKAEILCRRSS